MRAEITHGIHRRAFRPHTNELPQNHECIAFRRNPGDMADHGGIDEDLARAQQPALPFGIHGNQLADREMTGCCGLPIDADWRIAVIGDFDAIHANAGKTGDQAHHAGTATAGICLFAGATDT